MPLRAALNTVYAWQVKDLDAKGRKEFDDHLYGFVGDNERANRELYGHSPDGGA